MTFEYKKLQNKSELFCETIAISDIAKQVGTPFYLYSTKILQNNFNNFAAAFAKYNFKTTICFALKANSNLAVIKTFANLGGGADTVSEGEIRRALIAGVAPEKIVFSGVGKTIAEMEFALGKNEFNATIGQFNAESPEELEILNEVAGRMGKIAPVSVRVNPNVDASTHEKITTGRKCDKFGIDADYIFDVYKKARTLKNLDIQGITCHIGSQITTTKPYEQAFEKVSEIIIKLREVGHNIRRVDLGGGVGIDYNDNAIIELAEYAEIINKNIANLGQEFGIELILEPGRILVGDAGVLVSEVQFIKHTTEKNFVVIDAAMNDLMRPAMYGSYHKIIPVVDAKANGLYDVVGPVCESSDIMGKNRELPELKKGDFIAILSAGAYGSVMSGNYNTRPLVPEVLASGDKFEIIRKRETYAEIFNKETIPSWL
jgi:diaminopimelate decarboxylase